MASVRLISGHKSICVPLVLLALLCSAVSTITTKWSITGRSLTTRTKTPSFATILLYITEWVVTKGEVLMWNKCSIVFHIFTYRPHKQFNARIECNQSQRPNSESRIEPDSQAKHELQSATQILWKNESPITSVAENANPVLGSNRNKRHLNEREYRFDGDIKAMSNEPKVSLQCFAD